MRKIKFRVWHYIDEEMNYPDHIANNVAWDVFWLMQYTWLKDKNGKEIYEGDIIYCNTKSWLFGSNWIIVFNDKTESWDNSCNYCWFKVELSRRNWKRNRVLTKIWALKSQVIWNIHQNPELINK